MRISFIFFFVAFLLTSCATRKLIINSSGNPVQQLPQEKPSYTIYALGDAGEPNPQSKAVIKQLATVANNNPQPAMAIFLGDNIYPAGLPDSSDTAGYKTGTLTLKNQVDGLTSFKGKILFIPGNHDWNHFKAGGLEAIKREGEYLNKIEPNHVSFLPQNGCGGPVPVEINDHIVLLIIDSQWWIQKWDKEPGMNAECDIKSKEEFLLAFRSLVAKYKDRQIIVAMHHPFYTQGNHGGHYQLKDHLFPLTVIADWMYLPLPIIGSIYPYYRSVLGSSQDLANSKYSSLRDSLLNNLNYDGDLIFLSGHEHCLQYITKDKNHFLISGSGSHQTAIADGKDLVYGHKSAGFMKIDFYQNGNTWLSVYEVDPAKEVPNVVFSRPIIDKTRN